MSYGFSYPVRNYNGHFYRSAEVHKKKSNAEHSAKYWSSRGHKYRIVKGQDGRYYVWISVRKF